MLTENGASGEERLWFSSAPTTIQSLALSKMGLLRIHVSVNEWIEISCFSSDDCQLFNYSNYGQSKQITVTVRVNLHGAAEFINGFLYLLPIDVASCYC